MKKVRGKFAFCTKFYKTPLHVLYFYCIMSEIHTKKYQEEHPEGTPQESTTPVKTPKKSFFSGLLFKVIIILILTTITGGYAYFQSQKNHSRQSFKRKNYRKN